MKFSILLFVALTAVIVNAAPPADVCNGKLRQRKAYSTLSLADKKAFADGIWAMKRSGKYDYFTKKHRSALRWHQTTHFLPMHRAMMTEFETELLKAAPTLSGLPFWDEFSDLTNPTQSPIFTATTLGPMASGPISGTFKGLTDDRNAIVERDPDQSVMARAFKWIPRNQVLAKAIATFPTYGEMSHAIESTPHGTFHLIVGGHMGDPSTSPSDPAFWLHHCYIDLLWAAYQGTSTAHFTDYKVPGRANGDIQVNPTAGTAMYEQQYTNTDMLYYRQRLCYEYVAPNTMPPAQRAALALSTPAPESASTTAAFEPIQALPANRLKLLMPNMSEAEIAKRTAEVAATINDAAASLNAKVKAVSVPNGRESAVVPVHVATARLTTMHDMINQATEVAAKVIVDDFKNSLIPAVQAMRA